MPAQILVLGTAVTVGQESLADGFRTYLGELRTLLNRAQIDHTFVGPNSTTPAGSSTAIAHAAWEVASIDTSGGGATSLTAQLSGLRTSYPDVDLVILEGSWHDAYNNPTSLGTRFGTYLGAVQDGAWAAVPVIMVTLHPQPGQTEAQTNGAVSAYAALNAAMRNAQNSGRILADAAALTGAGSSWVDQILFDAQSLPEEIVMQGGGNVPNSWGGHRVTSFRSIVDYNSRYSQSAPFINLSPTGDLNLKEPTGSVIGHPRFMNEVNSIVTWVWPHAARGHAATNTGVQIRSVFAGSWRLSVNQWDWLFTGARPGNEATGTWKATGGSDPVRAIDAGDGISSIYRPSGNTGVEAWPVDTAPSRGILPFYGARNRNLIVDARCYLMGYECRLALIDQNGPDDRSRARFLVNIGGDYTGPGGYHFDRWAWPYNVMDGGNDRWRLCTWNDWRPLTSITLGKGGVADNGTNSHARDPGLVPPLSNFGEDTPHNEIGVQSVTADEIRANPPPVPPYLSSVGGPGWTATDYWTNPATATRDIQLVQAGAEKLAGVIARAIITSNVLADSTSGGGGGEPPSVPTAAIPNRSRRPNWQPKVSSGTSNWTLKNRDDGEVPQWETDASTVTVVAGAALEFPLRAIGSPAPTFALVGLYPDWLSIVDGELVGTAPATTGESVITVRATNTLATADIVLVVRVVAAAAIVTTSLPFAVQNQAYVATLALAGLEPLTLSISAGALNAGLALAGRSIIGTPTGTASATFTLLLTDSSGATASREFTIEGSAASGLPAITTTALDEATAGTAYSFALTGTGTGPLAWSLPPGNSLPPGLSLNASTGAISGTPTQAGGWGFVVRLSNAVGSTTKQFSLSVLAAGATEPIASPWARWTRG